MSEALQRAWLGFAGDHEPAVPTVTWEPSDNIDRKVLSLDTELTVERDPDARRREGWEG
jgi:carboxylesterase type B